MVSNAKVLKTVKKIVLGAWFTAGGIAMNETCPHKQDSKLTCLFGSANGPINCNLIDSKSWSKCRLFHRMEVLHKTVPEAWDMEQCCCQEWRSLFLKCAEDTGCYQGALDIRKANTDGKNVWRNYERVIFQYCPFCGKSPTPSPEKMQQEWRKMRSDRLSL